MLLPRSGVVVREEWCGCQGGVVWLSGYSRKCIILFKILQALVIEAHSYLCMFRQLRQAMHDPLLLRVNVERGHQFTQMQRRVLNLHCPPPAFHMGPYLNINHIEKRVGIDRTRPCIDTYNKNIKIQHRTTSTFKVIRARLFI